MDVNDPRTTSLMDLLLQGPSAQDRYQQASGLLGGSGQPMQGAYAGSVGGGGGSVEAQARQFFMQRGYSPQDWRKVDAIIDEGVGNKSPESGWNPHALNPSSGAAGIAQKISGFGDGYRENDPMSQIRWLFNYLNTHSYDGRTGIDAAYQHKKQTGWY